MTVACGLRGEHLLSIPPVPDYHTYNTHHMTWMRPGRRVGRWGGHIDIGSLNYTKSKEEEIKKVKM